jgi:hypothetical protein
MGQFDIFFSSTVLLGLEPGFFRRDQTALT